MKLLVDKNTDNIEDNGVRQIGPSTQHYVAPLGKRVTSITKNGDKTIQETMTSNGILTT
jgi:hypothetical protein